MKMLRKQEKGEFRRRKWNSTDLIRDWPWLEAAPGLEEPSQEMTWTAPALEASVGIIPIFVKSVNFCKILTLKRRGIFLFQGL